MALWTSCRVASGLSLNNTAAPALTRLGEVCGLPRSSFCSGVEGQDRSRCYRARLDGCGLDVVVVAGGRSQSVLLKLGGDILRGVIFVGGAAAAAVQIRAGKILKIAANACGTDG